MWFTGTRNAETAAEETKANQTMSSARNALQPSNVGGNGKDITRNIIIEGQ